MSDRDSPPPSWYEPPDGPETWPVTCRGCDRQHFTRGEYIMCPCGHTITTAEADRALASLREDRA